MKTSRTAVLVVPLAAAALAAFAAPAQADTCMLDDKGNQVCGASGTGPSSGPGSYTGFNGVHDGTPGQIGPDGQPLQAATPPPWMQPGWTPPPLPDSAQPAPNSPGLSTVKLAPGQVPPGVTAGGAAPAGPQTSKELPPAAPAAPAAQGGSATDPAGAASSAPSATPSATSTGTAAATPVPTMTEKAAYTSTASAEATAPAPAHAERTSHESSFSPATFLAALGGLGIAGALVWFVPGIRSAATALLHRGKH